MNRQENPTFKSFYEFGKWWFAKFSIQIDAEKKAKVAKVRIELGLSSRELERHMRENRCVGYQYN